MTTLTLDDSRWDLHLVVEDSTQHKQGLCAIMELDLTDKSSGKKEQISIEMTEEELVKMHFNLEKIQTQLDTLSKQ